MWVQEICLLFCAADSFILSLYPPAKRKEFTVVVSFKSAQRVHTHTYTHTHIHHTGTFFPRSRFLKDRIHACRDLKTRQAPLLWCDAYAEHKNSLIGAKMHLQLPSQSNAPPQSIFSLSLSLSHTHPLDGHLIRSNG